MYVMSEAPREDRPQQCPGASQFVQWSRVLTGRPGTDVPLRGISRAKEMPSLRLDVLESPTVGIPDLILALSQNKSKRNKNIRTSETYDSAAGKGREWEVPYSTSSEGE
ncbi:hypothetical protein J6590_041367 [Homalodisca vitripennis]|nr:hypothetical protein J6590_041367 [Homalodisca vitripennis]